MLDKQRLQVKSICIYRWAGKLQTKLQAGCLADWGKLSNCWENGWEMEGNELAKCVPFSSIDVPNFSRQNFVIIL